jgi:hypothetical protein
LLELAARAHWLMPTALLATSAPCLRESDEVFPTFEFRIAEESLRVLIG